MTLFSPPIVSSDTLTLFAIEAARRLPDETCSVRRNSAAVSVLVADSNNSSFVGTLTLYIPPTQMTGPYRVFCNTSGGGKDGSDSTTFIVDGEDPSKLHVAVLY